MTWWTKIDCGLDQHPKIIQAGYDGKNLFQLLLRINARWDFDGCIKPAYATATYLAPMLPLTVDDTAVALDRLAAAELITWGEDGTLFINGWDDYWKSDVDDASRQRRSRARKKNVTYQIRPDQNRSKETFNFDLLYAEYPRHEGKEKGMEAAERCIRTQPDYDALLGAVRNYRRQVAGTATKYILLWSTFMNGRWKDYIVPPDQTAPVLSKSLTNDALRKIDEARKQAAPPDPATLAELERISKL